jgi:hypothetical protein
MRHNHVAVVVAVVAAFAIGSLGIASGAEGAGLGLFLAFALMSPVIVTHEMFGGVGSGAIAVDVANTILSGTAMGWILGAWRPRREEGSR